MRSRQVVAGAYRTESIFHAVAMGSQYHDGMHVLIMPLGSFGDVYPHVGLGQRLAARGHDVTVLTNGHFRAAVEAAGLPFVEVTTDEQYQQMIDHPDLWHPRRGLRAIFSPEMQELVRLSFQSLRERVIPGKTAIIAGSLALSARVLRELEDVKLITVHLQPSVLRSIVQPPVLGRWKIPAWWPRWMVRGAFRLADALLVDPLIRPLIEPLRREHGLPPQSRYVKSWWNSPDLVLALFPEWYAHAPDWPANLRHAGFPLVDGRGEQPPLGPDLEKFLAEGRPPIVVTFGTGNIKAASQFAAAAEALERLGERGLLLTRFPQQIPGTLPSAVRHVDYLSFSTILPRSRAIVHHGGIGTSSQALAAGTPQIIMPLAHDQPDNAARLTDFGVARTLWPEKFTASNLARSLTELLNNPKTPAACADLADKMRGVDALGKACELIEQAVGPANRD